MKSTGRPSALLGMVRLSMGAIVLLFLVTGCFQTGDRADLVIINGQDPETLDPALATGVEDLLQASIPTASEIIVNPHWFSRSCNPSRIS